MAEVDISGIAGDVKTTFIKLCMLNKAEYEAFIYRLFGDYTV